MEESTHSATQQEEWQPIHNYGLFFLERMVAYFWKANCSLHVFQGINFWPFSSGMDQLVADPS